MRRLQPLAILFLATLGAAPSARAQPAVPLYRAEYQVLYKGRNLGHSQFAVSYDTASEHYIFSSRTSPRGLLKLVVGGPATEHSDFLALASGLRPLEFAYDDGSRKGEDNVRIVFDWEQGVATTSKNGGTERVSLRPGVLDRGTLQVALMIDMAAGRVPMTYWLADGSSLQSYEYRLDGDETIDVPAGSFATQRYVQQREGSSRSTWLWVAPDLDYLAVRIEQRRGAESRTAFVLESVEGLNRAASAATAR
jgi:Protein of unknown function (DUF3108)